MSSLRRGHANLLCICENNVRQKKKKKKKKKKKPPVQEKLRTVPICEETREKMITKERRQESASALTKGEKKKTLKKPVLEPLTARVLALPSRAMQRHDKRASLSDHAQVDSDKQKKKRSRSSQQHRDHRGRRTTHSKMTPRLSSKGKKIENVSTHFRNRRREERKRCLRRPARPWSRCATRTASGAAWPASSATRFPKTTCSCCWRPSAGSRPS